MSSQHRALSLKPEDCTLKAVKDGTRITLAHAGVPVEFHVYPGAYHAFIHSDSRVARIYQRDSLAALRRALGVTDLREVQSA